MLSQPGGGEGRVTIAKKVKREASGDVRRHLGLSQLEEDLLLASGGKRPDALLGILQHPLWPFPQKNCPAPYAKGV